MRWGLCWYGRTPVKRHVAGSIPATAASWKGKPIGDGIPFEAGRAKSPTMLRMVPGSTPSPSALMCPWPSGRGASLPSWRGGFDSHRALSHDEDRGSASGRPSGLEGRRRRFDPSSPNLHPSGWVSMGAPMRDHPTAGCDALNVVMLVQVQLPQLQRTEVIRPDEEPVLKTGGG